ncbi:MAG: hypothetical protein JW914_06120 [Syntrophaceae bacterium]|nr:hypothetical protein [Syntrophaceae bacterium]
MEEQKFIISKGTIKGKFKGFKNSSTIFEFTDGQKWRQSEAKFVNFFAVNPEVEIIQKAGKYYMEVKGLEKTVEVRRIK